MKNKLINRELVEFRAKDDLLLPGILYRQNKDKAIAIYLHGNGGGSIFFDITKNDFLAQKLLEKKISLLSFDNRGSHFIKKMDHKVDHKIKRDYFGMSYEKIKDCIYDIDGAISYVTKLGYTEIYLIGKSTGANKICVYNFYKPKNKIKKYVLFSLGDDIGGFVQSLGKARFMKLLNLAKKKVGEGQGSQIAKELLPMMFSYEGFLDIANPDGDYNVFPFYEMFNKIALSKEPRFKSFSRLLKQTLVIMGDKDEFVFGDVYQAVEALRDCRKDIDYKVVKGADHRFSSSQKQRELGDMIAGWLNKN